MKKIYLLKAYENYNANEIIEVSNELASSLIEQGVARETKNRDFLVKPEFIGSISRAFNSPPSRKFRKNIVK